MHRGGLFVLALALGLGGLRGQDAPSGLANPPPAPRSNTPVPEEPRTLSPVIWSENAEIVQRFSVDAGAARAMLDRAIMKLTSADDLGSAWSRLGITPQDVVGVKIATTGGPLMSSHRAIVQAICDGLQAAGVPPGHIIVWDKMASDMRAAGYSPVSPTYTHVGIASVFPGTGYDPYATYKNGLLGTLIWGDSDFIHHDGDDEISQAAAEAVREHSYGNAGDGGENDLLNPAAPQTSNISHFARLVSTICTKIVNVPVLTDNPYVGVNGCLATLALGCVDNNRRFQGDPTFGDPAVDEIVANPILRRKVVVHIMDALVAQYAGGPRFDPQFTRSIGALYVSRDPVAIDSIVYGRLEKWRAADRQGRIDPIGKTASHIHSASSFHLGTDDASRIQLVKITP